MSVNTKQKLKNMPIMPMPSTKMTPQDMKKLKDDSMKVRKQIQRNKRKNRKTY